MKKCLFFVLIVILGMSAMGYGEKLATLPELIRPGALAIDDEQIYVAQEVEIYIYSLEDFSFKTKFGKAGEGPQEFKTAFGGGTAIRIIPYDDHLLVNSAGKISYYSKNGKYIKEIKIPSISPSGGSFQPAGSGFIGMDAAISSEDQSLCAAINLYDKKMTKIKEIFRKNVMQRGRMQYPAAASTFYVLRDRIILGGDEEFILNIFDIEGNTLPAIKRDYKRLKVTDEYKERVHKALKKNPATKPLYEAIKKLISFPDYFPAIQLFCVDAGKIYIMTYLEEDEKYETFIYSKDGKILKRVFLPFKYTDGVEANPYTFHNNKFYQLIENEETEEWELHAAKIE